MMEYAAKQELKVILGFVSPPKFLYFCIVTQILVENFIFYIMYLYRYQLNEYTQVIIYVMCPIDNCESVHLMQSTL